MDSLPFSSSPITDEIGDAGIAAFVAVRPDLRKQCLGSTPVLLDSMRIGFERLFQCGLKHRELARPLASAVRWRRCLFGRSQPSAYRVARQTRLLRYLMQRQFVA